MDRKENLFPLSGAQKMLLTGELFSIEPKKIKENNVLEFYILTPESSNFEVEIILFERALSYVIRNNDALRIRMKWTPKGIKQYISSVDYYEVPRIAVNGKEGLEEFIAHTDRYEFKWTGESLLKAFFVIFEKNKGALILRIHHAIFDGYSIALFMEQFKKAYYAYKKGEDLEDSNNPSIIDAYKNIEKYKETKRYIKDKKYFFQKYNHQRKYSFPAGYRSERGACDFVSYVLEGDAYKKLISLASELKCSVESVLMSVISFEVLKLTGKENFCLQAVTHGRFKASELKTIGSLQNSVPVFYDLDSNKKISELIRESYIDYLESLSHSKFPATSQIPLSYKESFKHGLNFMHSWMMFSSMEYGEFKGKTDISFYDIPLKNQPFQFYCAMLETKGSQIVLELTYQTHKYKKEQCRDFIKLGIDLLQKIENNKDITLKELINK